MTIVSSLFGAITPNETVNSLFSLDTTPQETQSTEKPKKVKKKESKEKSTERPEGKVGKKKAEKKDKKDKKEVKEEEIEEEKKEDSVEITHGDSSDEETPKSNATETRREKIQKIIEKNERTIFVGNLPVTVIEKAFSEKLPRKQAFIAKKLHEKRESLNAYIVFKESEAAKKALSLNGAVFMDHHIRVDIAEKKQEKQRDSKRCVFIGNLPFDIADEQVWGFFEGVGEIENVRLIRDRKTNVGKGFGYVQFKERASVVLALKLNDNELEGRKLRVTRAVESLADKSEKATKVVEGTRAKRDHGIKLKTKPKVGKKKTAPGQVKKTRAQVLAKKIGKAVRTGKKL
ncbi:Nucleolar protein 12 [Boothiomyces sp. JEL0838]|nr:Nucleolar protein 12 [Boothiomyces sp. JEL0838]